jgi:2-dehydro-3-deoxygluconokinase
LLATNQWQIAVPAQPVAKVLDTSGAGDAFAAAFIWAWLVQGGTERPLTAAELSAAAQAGHQLAAAVVQQAGAIVAQIPTLTLNAAASANVYANGVADVAAH